MELAGASMPVSTNQNRQSGGYGGFFIYRSPNTKKGILVKIVSQVSIPSNPPPLNGKLRHLTYPPTLHLVSTSVEGMEGSRRISLRMGGKGGGLVEGWWRVWATTLHPRLLNGGQA